MSILHSKPSNAPTATTSSFPSFSSSSCLSACPISVQPPRSPSFRFVVTPASSCSLVTRRYIKVETDRVLRCISNSLACVYVCVCVSVCVCARASVPCVHVCVRVNAYVCASAHARARACVLTPRLTFLKNLKCNSLLRTVLKTG